MSLYKLIFMVLVLTNGALFAFEAEYGNTQPFEDSGEFLDETLLRAAVYGDLKPIVDFIEIQQGDINLKYEDDGDTMLMIAARQGQTEVVKYLINKAADLNIQDVHSSFTALHYAAVSGHFEVVKLLINAGCDYNIKDCSGNTAFDVAQERYLQACRDGNKSSSEAAKISTYQSICDYLLFLNKHGIPFERYIAQYQQKQLAEIEEAIGLPKELTNIVWQYCKFADLNEYNRFHNN